jgi:hypothetical protein
MAFVRPTQHFQETSWKCLNKSAKNANQAGRFTPIGLQSPGQQHQRQQQLQKFLTHMRVPAIEQAAPDNLTQQLRLAPDDVMSGACSNKDWRDIMPLLTWLIC